MTKPVFWMLALAASLCAQEPDQPPPKPQPDAQQLLAEMKAQFAKERLVFDAKAGTVTIPAVVNNPQDPIEYLLIHRRGKRHEAVFFTHCKPSVLNGALLLLGFVPGKNATYVEKDPPPSLEEVQQGVDPIIVTPPQGQGFWMTVRWKTPEGELAEHCVEDLLLDLGTQEPVADCSWVYIGGRMAALYRNEPEVYVADFEGNLISVCYLSPDNHLATMVHEKARDDRNWWTTALVPPPDTEVEFVFHKHETRLHKERQQRLAKAKAAKEAPPKDAPKEPPRQQ